MKWVQEDNQVRPEWLPRINGTDGQVMMATLVWLVFQVQLDRKANQDTMVHTDLLATMVLLESMESLVLPDQMVSAVTKDHKDPWDLMDTLDNLELTELMVLQDKSDGLAHEEVSENADQMEIPGSQEFLDRLGQIMFLVKAIAKVRSLVSGEFKAISVQKASLVKRDGEEKREKTTSTVVNQDNQEKLVLPEGEDREVTVKIADSFLPSTLRYEQDKMSFLRYKFRIRQFHLVPQIPRSSGKALATSAQLRNHI